MKVSVLNIKRNKKGGGDKPGEPKEPTEVFNVVKSSPNKGAIKISLNPTEELNVGDAVQMKATLTAPGNNFEQFFWVKIADKEQKKEKVPKKETDNEPMGLPQLVFVYKEPNEEDKTAASWENVETRTNKPVDYNTVMVPEAEGKTLKTIFINMDSSVLKNFKAKEKHPSQDQLELANRKYYTSVYFHTLFLYTISKNQGYEIKQRINKENENERVNDIDIEDYLMELFDNYYSTFILNFGGMAQMMQGIGD